MEIRFAIATEDELSEAVALRIIKYVKPDHEPSLLLRGGGFGYLKSKMKNWIELSRQVPIFLITDLDDSNCASALINNWLNGGSLNENLIFRVAVREVEAWLLADDKGIATLMERNVKVPRDPDTLNDPKAALLRIASSASRKIKQELVQKNGVISSQGIGYNARLILFIENEWNLDYAKENSPSLNKAVTRIKEYFQKRTKIIH